MNRITKNILLLVAAVLSLGMASCTDYLDKAPDSDIAEDDAYKDFTNFQGFVEELYNCLPIPEARHYSWSLNWGEDEIQNVGIDYHMVYAVDQGDFWHWQHEYDGWNVGWMDSGNFLTGNVAYGSSEQMNRGLWPGCWYGIWKANLGLENLNKLTDATEEQKNLIRGQLLFFRGMFHFQLIQYFGGLPYINKVLSSSEKLRLPRLSYDACADSIAKDLTEAAKLLPTDWDNTDAGQMTIGQNQLRVTKYAALAYLGKNYLWAASPLMNEENLGHDADSTEYNKDYAKKAAETFGQLINLIEGDNNYGLLDFSEYSNNFYTADGTHRVAGQNKEGTTTEALFRVPCTGWNIHMNFLPLDIADAGVTNMPTANYVDNYGMANGLPITDPASGYDPTHPWQGRDPRFYNDIIYDGVKLLNSDQSSYAPFKYAQLYTGGNIRDVKRGSRTGYLLRKFEPLSCNKVDNQIWPLQWHQHLPWIRLADVYLMYAEAAAEAAGSPTGQYKCNYTAVGAVNKVRERAGVGEVGYAYSRTLNPFMRELRRERAVELAFEGHRFNDLRRWKLLDVYPYNIKTSVEFTRVTTNNSNSQAEQVTNLHEEQILKRNFSKKHYWLPLKNADTKMYLEFNQNPGW